MSMGGRSGSAEGLSASRVGGYEILAEISRDDLGAMSLARPLVGAGADRGVAVFQCHADLCADPEFKRLVLSDLSSIGGIAHPNVLAALEVIDGAQVAIVTDLVEGVSLAEILGLLHDRSERVPVSLALRIGVDVLNGLQAAHSLMGIAHSGLSPHGILLATDGVARISDLGTARARTRAANLGARPVSDFLAYKAPEQFGATSTEYPVDQYAVGEVLWEALCGRARFSGGSVAAALKGRAEVIAPSTIVPSLPRALDTVIARALSLDPATRFGSCAGMAQALAKCGAPVAPAAELAKFVGGATADIIARRSGGAVRSADASGSARAVTSEGRAPAPPKRAPAPSMPAVRPATVAPPPPAAGSPTAKRPAGANEQSVVRPLEIPSATRTAGFPRSNTLPGVQRSPTGTFAARPPSVAPPAAGPDAPRAPEPALRTAASPSVAPARTVAPPPRAPGPEPAVAPTRRAAAESASVIVEPDAPTASPVSGPAVAPAATIAPRAAEPVAPSSRASPLMALDQPFVSAPASTPAVSAPAAPTPSPTATQRFAAPIPANPPAAAAPAFPAPSPTATQRFVAPVLANPPAAAAPAATPAVSTTPTKTAAPVSPAPAPSPAIAPAPTAAEAPRAPEPPAPSAPVAAAVASTAFVRAAAPFPLPMPDAPAPSFPDPRALFRAPIPRLAYAVGGGALAVIVLSIVIIRTASHSAPVPVPVRPIEQTQSIPTTTVAPVAAVAPAAPSTVDASEPVLPLRTSVVAPGTDGAHGRHPGELEPAEPDQTPAGTPAGTTTEQPPAIVPVAPAPRRHHEYRPGTV